MKFSVALYMMGFGLGIMLGANGGDRSTDTSIGGMFLIIGIILYIWAESRRR